ncbi:2OG-Fe(II) oxygenase [Azohydromonas australica]|uniref:2OG-Fe(II) oxygenase n=1 Tax=Azohydromonas australica TaxID=364039 RepID=UPI00042464EB|nr:2OG-Fe(II) oxygenase [Azohydromonas australica]
MRMPLVGEPAPWFVSRCTSNERYHFDTVAGRYVVLCFFATARDVLSRAVLDGFLHERRAFDDVQACFFGVSVDPEDEAGRRVQQSLPGIRHFWDHDLNVSRLYGRTDGHHYVRASFILDERLRVYAVVPFGDDARAHVATVLQTLSSAPRLGTGLAAQVPAPVLIIPRVFEPQLCRRLIDYYDEGGAQESGFMREVGGKTVGMHDYGHKRRSDKHIADEALRTICMSRIHHRVVPEVHKAFQFHASRIERHIVACYDGESGGHFRAHRDNTTKGTAHRRFAVSVVLNSGEFEGGQLHFPEFGHQTYSPPAGGAVVFSCSLLHAAMPVTRGRRYTYLPFLYDDAAATIREQNQGFLVTPGDMLENSGAAQA